MSDEDPAEDSSHSLFEQGQSGRRRKAALALTVIWGGTIVLHLVSWGYWLILGLTTLIGFHAIRILLTRSPNREELLPTESLSEDLESFPHISILVAAKNEETVISNLVKLLCNLDYPEGSYDLWVIDDHSTDQTPALLDQLAQEYPQLKVIHRPAGAGGGKSGALNEVFPQTKGDILAVFDADAQVSPDILRRVLPLFQTERMGAVQLRKATLEHSRLSSNFWIQGQVAEMALDAFYQQRRIAIGGIGELRGNGQFVRREALESCGGWNEQTITDDLDLTLRLHLQRWNIGFLAEPAVLEEGVTTFRSLWHQRSRWAEGGYQRYLDYWRLILSQRLSPRKKLDLFIFWLIQYILPTAAIPDFLMSLVRNRFPLLSPVTSLTLSLSVVGMFLGLRGIQGHQRQPITSGATSASLDKNRSLLKTLVQTLQGTLYMLHWVLIITSTTARMSIRPKRLRWVKTVHQGVHESPTAEG